MQRLPSKEATVQHLLPSQRGQWRRRRRRRRQDGESCAPLWRRRVSFQLAAAQLALLFVVGRVHKHLREKNTHSAGNHGWAGKHAPSAHGRYVWSSRAQSAPAGGGLSLPSPLGQACWAGGAWLLSCVGRGDSSHPAHHLCDLGRCDHFDRHLASQKTHKWPTLGPASRQHLGPSERAARLHGSSWMWRAARKRKSPSEKAVPASCPQHRRRQQAIARQHTSSIYAGRHRTARCGRFLASRRSARQAPPAQTPP